MLHPGRALLAKLKDVRPSQIFDACKLTSAFGLYELLPRILNETR